ncbi:hypothetical protein WJX74_001358 [Apatococcus lobatus]|uniref:FIST domain-containing protein n=1 Tax=Apatococcus lobatus TaxID=904363 RepID=A0AAW1QWR4_9CHLO
MFGSLTAKQLLTSLQASSKAAAAEAASSYRLLSWFSTQPAGRDEDQPVCRFGGAYSDKPTLAQSITECVASVKQQLGDETQLDLCQLLVSLGHGEHLRLAPMYITEMLSNASGRAPVVIGGVVQGLITPMVPLAPSGVSLLAASLPGTTLYPFHTTSTDLPVLPGRGWADLLGTSAQPHTATTHTSALLMAEPHFTTVETLLSRLQTAVPGMGIVGGVLQPGAWGGGHQSMRGAVFNSTQVYDEGAVGCILQGPVQLDTICTVGFRPIGRSAEITAAQGGSILELDGQPALQVMRDLWTALEHVEPPDRGLAVQWQVPSQLASQVACDEVQPATRLQLLVRDPAFGRKALEANLKRYLGDLPPGICPEQGTLGGLLYSCVHSQQEEHRILHTSCPSLPWQGCMVQGEFGPAGTRSGPAVMHSYSSSLGFLRSPSLPAKP